MTSDERQAYAKKMFSEYPELFSIAHQQEILNGHIVIDMAPFEAKLAGGAFAFKVAADPARWPPNADPYRVMWAQSTAPDESQIWMTFENDTQYPGEGRQSFRVHFRGGRSVRIEKLEVRA